jgi:hypothetical protein
MEGGWGRAHEVVAAVADGEMVEFFEGDAALTLADVAWDRVVDGAVRDQQGALLALSLAIDFNTDDRKHEPFVAARIRRKHLVELRVAIDAHVIVFAHA